MKVLYKITLPFLFLVFVHHSLLAQYAIYKEDRDGDGVPNVRDKCPDTNKNLDGQEFKIQVDGKDVYVKITNVKENFSKRKRRLLVDISRLRREQKKLLEPIDGNRDKMKKLDADTQTRIIELDTLIEEQKMIMAKSVYEANVKVNGKEQIVEVPINVDEFGCLPDRDRDDVPDLVDKCPDDPGLKIYNGCNDRDGDTVLDPVDECPDEPGLVELKGCPDKGEGDRDKDGTIDRDDLCPDTPGPKSNKGCPEILNSSEKDIISRASKVLFDSGLATLRPESTETLDELAQLIKDKAQKYGKLRVRLEGHTDTDGAEESNLTLSRNRARAVKDYLVSKGIDIGTISTSGYGEERLKVSPERNPADKQANRRVEIAITNQ